MEVGMQQVEIRVDGYMDEEWLAWLDGFSMSHSASNETILHGTVRDQAALYGLIGKMRDLGVKLISFHCDVIDLDNEDDVP
jgi:hypothetical protein